MDTHHLLTRHGKQAKRIAVAQIGLGGERQLGQVLQGRHIIGVHPGRIKLGAVHRRVGIGMVQRGFEPLQLQRPQLIDAGFFNRFEGQVHVGTTCP